MNITLENLYLATGTIAFVSITVSIIVASVFFYKVGKKVEEAQEQGKMMMREAVYKKYTMQAGVLRVLISIFGGDDQHDR